MPLWRKRSKQRSNYFQGLNPLLNSQGMGRKKSVKSVVFYQTGVGVGVYTKCPYLCDICVGMPSRTMYTYGPSILNSPGAINTSCFKGLHYPVDKTKECDIHQMLDDCGGGGSRQSGGASLPSNRAKHSLQIAIVHPALPNIPYKLHQNIASKSPTLPNIPSKFPSYRRTPNIAKHCLKTSNRAKHSLQIAIVQTYTQHCQTLPNIPSKLYQNISFKFPPTLQYG